MTVEEQVRQDVYDSIFRLSEYFGVQSPSEEWVQHRFPKISILPELDSYTAYMQYGFTRNRLLVKRGYENETPLLLHEVSHWWHKMSNPGLFRAISNLGQRQRWLGASSRYMAFERVAESVAYCAAGMALGDSNIPKLDDMEFTDLVQMDLPSALAMTMRLMDLRIQSRQFFERWMPKAE